MERNEKSTSACNLSKGEVNKHCSVKCVILVVTVGLLIVIWLLWPMIALWWSNNGKGGEASSPYSTAGSFGDLFGSYNALVSLLAFGGFLYALHMQKKDLQLQREEMRQSREEMEHQTAQFQEQTELLEAQLSQQKKHNKLNQYVSYAYRIETVFEKFVTAHKGAEFARTICDLHEFFFYTKASCQINHKRIEIALDAHMKLYSELEFICTKVCNFIQTVSDDKSITQEDYMQIALILSSSWNTETRLAIQFYLMHEPALIAGNNGKKEMLIKACNLEGGETPEDMLIRKAKVYMNYVVTPHNSDAISIPEKITAEFIEILTTKGARSLF